MYRDFDLYNLSNEETAPSAPRAGRKFAPISRLRPTVSHFRPLIELSGTILLVADDMPTFLARCLTYPNCKVESSKRVDLWVASTCCLTSFLIPDN